MRMFKVTVLILLFSLLFSTVSHAAKSELVLKDVGRLTLNKVFCKEGAKLPPADSLSIREIQSVWDRLSKAAGFSSFVMYDPSDEINAYIMQVDKEDFLVVIQLGLLKVLKTEDEIAGVVGHEIGHGVRRHSEKRQGNNAGIMIGANILSSVLGGGALADLAAGIGANLAASGYSRENEVEADDFGVEYSTKAGFSPWGLYNSINSMAKAGLVTPPSGFNSHPPTERRMTNLRNQAQKWEKTVSKTAKTETVINNTGKKQVEAKVTANSAVNKSDNADVIASYPISAGEKNALTALHNRSIALYNSGKYKEALEGFKRGANSYEGNYLAALWAARSAQKLKNSKEMKIWIDRALEINPNYLPAQDFKYMYF